MPRSDWERYQARERRKAVLAAGLTWLGLFGLGLFAAILLWAALIIILGSAPA